MARYISKYYKTLRLTSSNDRPEVMPICHCVDHHCATGIVHFYDPSIIYNICDVNDKYPFGKLFYKLFNEIVGINARRAPSRISHDDEAFSCGRFVRETRSAQKLYLISKQSPQIKRATRRDTYILKYKLNISWLSGLVGVIEVKGNPTVLVTLRPDDPYQLIAIRKPTRNMTELISPKREEDAKKIAKNILKRGINLTNGGIKCLDNFRDKKLFLMDNEEYRIGSDIKSSQCWDEVCHLQFEIPLHDTIEKNIKNALIYIGDGIEKDAFYKLDTLINSTEIDVLSRVIYYIHNFDSVIEINKISRDGGAANYSVSLQDIPCYRFLLTVSQIFPVALRAHSPGKFTVLLAPMMWTISDIIKKMRDKNTIHISWKEKCKIDIYDRADRKPWRHQIETIEEMKRNFHNGLNGIFLYLFVGMGKTMIVMMYCMYLETIKKLSKYIIYTLPKSAIESIVYEIQSFGFPINYIIPLKNIKDKSIPKNITVNQKVILLPYHINLIKYDHMSR